MTGLEHVGTPELVSVILSNKQGIEKAVEKYESYDQAFFIFIAVLRTLEQELRNRGLNPKDPNLGKDWLGAWDATEEIV